MGLGRGAETLSLCLECAGILLFAGVLGATVAIAAAQPVVKQIDPLPDRPPAPVFVVPSTSILLRLAALGGAGRRSRGDYELARAAGRRERGAACRLSRCVTCAGLSKTYETPSGGIEALHSVDASFTVGEITAVVGPSGSGKSTLLRALAGLDRPSTGSLRADGRELAHASPAELRHHRLATVTFVNQKAADNFVPHLTVREHAESLPEAGRLLADFGLGRARRLAADPALGRRAGAGRLRARARARDAGDRGRRADRRARPRLGRAAARRDPPPRGRGHGVRDRDARRRRDRDRRPRALPRPRPRRRRPGASRVASAAHVPTGTDELAAVGRAASASASAAARRRSRR